MPGSFPSGVRVHVPQAPYPGALGCQAVPKSGTYFYGDKRIIDGLVRVGIALEQARDYALSGCTEVVSPGLGNWGAPNGWINLVDADTLRDAQQHPDRHAGLMVRVAGYSADFTGLGKRLQDEIRSRTAALA